MNDKESETERRRAEAAQWFARLKTLPVSHGTLNDFFAWRRQPGNGEAFEEAERFWSSAERVGESPEILRAIEAAERRKPARRHFGVAVRPVKWLAASIFSCFSSVADTLFLPNGGRLLRPLLAKGGSSLWTTVRALISIAVPRCAFASPIMDGR